MASISYTSSDFLNKITSNGNRYVSNYTKRVREADTGVQDSQDEIADFRKKLRTLKNYDTDNFDTDEVKRNLTSFVESYNSLKEAVTAADNDELNEKMEELDQLLEDNSTSLKKLGVKIGDDELTFDEDTFDDLEDKEVKKYADKLLTGSDSFIASAYKTMRGMEETSEDEEFNIVKRKFYTVTEYSDTEIEAAKAAKSLLSTLTSCADTAKDYENTDEDSVKSSLSSFTSYYNALLTQNESLDNASIESVQSLTESNTDALKELGITQEETDAGEATSQLSYDDTVPEEEAYSAVFGTESEYASQMTNLCESVINSVLKAEKIGITLDVKV